MGRASDMDGHGSGRSAVRAWVGGWIRAPNQILRKKNF
jgi:hypothetical protein